MAEIADLKPCPFCGSADRLQARSIGSLHHSMPGRPFHVVCLNVDCEEVSGPVGYGKHDAIARWNTRALDAKDKRIAELSGGWQPIETAPKDVGGTFLAVNVGSIERWHTYKEGCVVTRRADTRAFTCCRMPDGSFMDEFGDEYLPDGRINDAEDLTAEDGVLRLAMWLPLPAIPSLPSSNSNG